jgi:hypothetical protein
VRRDHHKNLPPAVRAGRARLPGQPADRLREAPSAPMLGRLGKLLDPDELEAALSAAEAVIALDPAVPAAYAAHHTEEQRGKQE